MHLGLAQAQMRLGRRAQMQLGLVHQVTHRPRCIWAWPGSSGDVLGLAQGPDVTGPWPRPPVFSQVPGSPVREVLIWLQGQAKYRCGPFLGFC